MRIGEDCKPATLRATVRQQGFTNLLQRTGRTTDYRMARVTA